MTKPRRRFFKSSFTYLMTEGKGLFETNSFAIDLTETNIQGHLSIYQTVQVIADTTPFNISNCAGDCRDNTFQYIKLCR